MFADWGDFFLLMGGASGAFIGLLFVVTTLASNLQLGQEQLARGQAQYMTPTLFHFVTVLVLSGVGIIPGMTGWIFASIAAPWAALSLVYCLVTAFLIRRRRLPDAGHMSDVWGYGILPATLYAGLLAIAWVCWINTPSAPYALAVVLLALTIVAIRNAWDLVAYIAPRAEDSGG